MKIKIFIIEFLLCGVTTGYGMQQDENKNQWVKEIRQELVSCIERAWSFIIPELVLAKNEKRLSSSVAVIFEIDDVCILSPESYDLIRPLLKNKNTFEPFPLGDIALFFSEVNELGITIFFVTTRPDKHPINQKDAIDDHKQLLRCAGYAVDKEHIFFVCAPIEKHLDPFVTVDIINEWKKTEYEKIEKKYKIAAALDGHSFTHARHIKIPRVGDFLLKNVLIK
jgi:hypothetical protein